MPTKETALLSDSACIEKVLKGEPNAFNAVVARYRSQAFTLILMMTRDKAVAEDLTQEAFLRAYRKLAMFDRDKPFYPWLAAISVRLTLNWIRRVRPRQDQENDEESER